MKTDFSYNENLEKERIVCLLHYLAVGLYQSQGFLVLPYRRTQDPKAVYLPKLENFQPKKYLSQLKEIYPDIPLDKNKPVKKVFQAIKKSSYTPEKIDLAHTKLVEKNWQQLESQFEDYFFDVFPKFRRYNIFLQVYWTKYGTVVSFGTPIVKRKKANLKIYLRDDMGTAQIVEGFLSAIFRKQLEEDLDYSWLQREALIDFLLQNSKLARLFPDYIPTLGSQPKDKKRKQKDYKTSASYLQELGFATIPGICLKDDQIYINNKLPKYPFSKSEKKILKRLVVKIDEPVSYYELGDLVWGEKVDKFSLWALSQLIYKIRNKLEKNGLSAKHIKNLYGEGYYYTSQV